MNFWSHWNLLEVLDYEHQGFVLFDQNLAFWHAYCYKECVIFIKMCLLMSYHDFRA